MEAERGRGWFGVSGSESEGDGEGDGEGDMVFGLG